MMAGLRVDYDDLGGGPTPAAPLDLVAPGFQGFDDLVGRLRLDAQAIRIPLMMKAGRRDGGLWIHLPVNDVQDREQRRRDDPGPTRAARHHEESTVPIENRRCHAR